MKVLNIDDHAKKYIDFVKSKEFCTACLTRGPVDPDHLRAVGMGNNRKRPSERDFTCIPLCRSCHIERGQIGNYQFEHKWSVNLWKDAHNLLMEYLCRE